MKNVKMKSAKMREQSLKPIQEDLPAHPATDCEEAPPKITSKRGC